MAHTPGPWKISEFDGQHYISDANGKVIAQAILCDEQEDNALLLAASTELLEALEEVTKWFGNVKGHTYDGVLLDINEVAHVSVLIRARTAIAKAKGQ